MAWFNNGVVGMTRAVDDALRLAEVYHAANWRTQKVLTSSRPDPLPLLTPAGNKNYPVAADMSGYPMSSLRADIEALRSYIETEVCDLFLDSSYNAYTWQSTLAAAGISGWTNIGNWNSISPRLVPTVWHELWAVLDVLWRCSSKLRWVNGTGRGTHSDTVAVIPPDPADYATAYANRFQNNHATWAELVEAVTDPELGLEGTVTGTGIWASAWGVQYCSWYHPWLGNRHITTGFVNDYMGFNRQYAYESYAYGSFICERRIYSLSDDYGTCPSGLDVIDNGIEATFYSNTINVTWDTAAPDTWEIEIVTPSPSSLSVQGPHILLPPPGYSAITDFWDMRPFLPVGGG